MQPTYSNRLTTLKSRAMIEHRDIQDHTTKSKQMQYLLDLKIEKLRLLQNEVKFDTSSKKKFDAELGRKIIKKRQTTHYIAVESENHNNKLAIFFEKESRKKLLHENKHNAILLKISNLPAVLLSYIQEYIPFDVRIQLLDDRYNTNKLIKKMDKYALNALILKIYTTPAYFSFISTEMALDIERFRRFSEWGMLIKFNVKEAQILAIELMYKLKNTCPEIALKWSKIICIMVNPVKKYTADIRKLFI